MSKLRSVSQAERRQYAEFHDIHGRTFECVVEKATGHPTGPISPKGWNPPTLTSGRELLPPPNHLIADPVKFGRLNINYQGWMQEQQAAHDSWHAHLERHAAAMFPNNAGEMILHPPATLLAAVGPKPDPIEPIMAASKGNRYCLGLSQKCPEWAVPFFSPPKKVEAMAFPDAEGDEGEDEALVLADDDEEVPVLDEAVDALSEFEDDTPAPRRAGRKRRGER